MQKETPARPKVRKTEVAEYCGKVTERCIDVWRAERGFPTIKIGRVALFDLDAVDRWLDEQQTEPVDTLQLGEPRQPRTQDSRKPKVAAAR